VLAAAADEPDRLVVGIDANAAGMATASRRAAATPRRGGLPNALFVVAAIGALPRELDGLADVVTVHFPWGSLLRGLLGAEPIREPAMRALAASYASWGLAVTKAQPATATDIAAAHSTWGKRLRACAPARGGRRGCCAPGSTRRARYRRPRRRLRKNKTSRTMTTISSSVVSRIAPPLCRARLPGRPGA
jgi:16S rRNA (adenine(1408)-N(1))-methyltransferase